MHTYYTHTHTHTHTHLAQTNDTKQRSHGISTAEAAFRPHGQDPGPCSKMFIPLTAPLTVAASTT